MTKLPTAINLHKASKTLGLTYGPDEVYQLPADILLLQELDENAKPSHYQDQLALLQALGVFDLVAAEGRQLAADAAEDVPVGDEVGFPVEGLGAAWVEVDQAFLQQGKLVLVVGRFGVFVEFLQQQDVGLFVADHPGHFVEAERHV